MTSKIPLQKKLVLPTGALFLGFFAMAIFQGCLGATLSELASNADASLDKISILFSVLFTGSLIGSFLSGTLFDRFHPMRVLALTLLTGALSLIFIPLVRERWLLACIFLFLGLARGSIDLGANLMLVWLHGKNAGPFLNALHAVFGLGSFLTPIIIGKILGITGSIQQVYWGLSLLVFPISLLFFFLPRPTAIQNPQTENPPLLIEDPRQTTPVKFILLFSLILFLVIGSGNSFSGWVLTYTQSVFTQLVGQTTYHISATFWIMIAITRIVTIPIMSHIPPHRVLFFDISGFALSFFCMLLFPENLVLFWILVAFAGITVATIFAAVLVYCNSICGMKGSSTRWLYLIAGFGNIIIPWVVGQFFKTHGPAWMHIVHLFFILLGLFVLLLLLKFTKTKNGEIYES